MRRAAIALGILETALAVDRADIEFVGEPLFIAWLSYKHWKRPGIFWPFNLPFWRFLWLFVLTLVVAVVLPATLILGSAYVISQAAGRDWQPICLVALVIWLPIIIMRERLWARASGVIKSQESGPREAARTVALGLGLLLLLAWQTLRPHDIVIADLCEDAKSVVEDWTGSNFELQTVKQGKPGGCLIDWHGENAIVTVVGELRSADKETAEKWRVSLLPIGGRGANGRHSFVTYDSKVGGSFHRFPLGSEEQ
jgi:hypothetical protein